MLRLVYDYPTVESSEPLETYARTSPHRYSSIAAADKYLLRYASNTWTVRFPLCVVLAQTQTVRLPVVFDTRGGGGGPLSVEIPGQSLSAVGLVAVQECSETASVTLEAGCEVYFLAESVLVRLPQTERLSTLYPQLPRDGLAFCFSYTDILGHRIQDNLTRLGLSVQGCEMTLSPLQRFPPQPLVAGVFQRYADLTPLQALQLVDSAIVDGRELVRKMTEYTRSAGSAGTSAGTGAGTEDEVLLFQSGQGDDDGGGYAESYTEDDAVGMHVEMVGGFKAAGVKRARRRSDEAVAADNDVAAAAAAAAAKHKRLYSAGI
ncbi:hypothetical protein PICMEDRAFT_72375 [Pichia membranifaciens NRRL Y-2026]|uniref:Uncharacterized protein n=1 Tax=Pichia membranifaciens NRRL Y-2026 TaxID=763406 RepID=A0A1E3NJH6_9ASCO|nr:hypothetical protein PICMEDRAFT_72375 [Pichia membranifaciens NRRL Y-2026]ODQ46294.1 hypothetical protein PICMEDRAFT_72375 [Pichia membranifaciens NRRL Y-2026]